jgi:folate-dependent phosphoribosylglycinamide formyltransferase PurN
MWRERFPFLSGKRSAPGSAPWQHGLAPQDEVSRGDADRFEEALVAKLAGSLDEARTAFAELLDDGSIAAPLRAECHYQMSELLQWDHRGAVHESWVQHAVAAHTFQENHFRAVRALRPAAPTQPGPRPDAPRIALVLGSNAATVAFANAILDRWPIAALLQQYAEFPVLARSWAPKPEAPPLGLSPAERMCFPDEAVLGNRWNAIFHDTRVPTRYIGRGEANREATLAWLHALDLDLIVSHGPERLRPEFLEAARLGGINVHWGLSPTYRGMDTARWPLLQHKPEWIGVTIHKLDAELDTGPILYQARPQLRPGQSFRQIEYSLTNLACEIVPRAVDEVLASRDRAVPQDTSRGTQYWADQWSRRYERLLTPSYIAAEIEAYHAEREARDAKAPLINPWRPS